MKKTLITVSDLEKKEEPVQGKYPKFWMFGELPAWGFYARQADGIQFRNVRIILWKADVRPAMVLDDVLRVSTDQLSVSSAPHDPVFVMQDVRDASFKRLDFPTSQRGAIKMQGNCEKTEGLQ